MPDVEVGLLRQRLAEAGMTGTIRLVDLLRSIDTQPNIISGSPTKLNFRLNLGQPHADPPVTPLEDLDRQFVELSAISADKRKDLDDAIGEIADSMKRKIENPESFTKISSDADL